MNKTVFRFWIINVLISILLFIGYRVMISLTPTVEGNSFEKWMQILDVLLNIGFSLIYLIAMIISSFTILLNMIKTIRNNLYLSLLTFLAIPLFCVILTLIDIHLKMLLLFSIAYLIIMTISFLLFRKRVNKINFD